MAVKVAATIEPMGQANFPVVSANHVSGLATVATTGDYNDLINTPGGGGSTNSEYAQKIGTDTSHPAIGSTSLPVYVNSAGAVTPITELEVAGSHIIPAQTGTVDHIANIYEAAWSTYKNAWECGYPTPLTVATDWTVDRATIIIGGTEYYVLMSDFASSNLNNYCPNASSYITGTWAPIKNLSDNSQVSGMCLQKQNSGNILLWMDTVIYAGEGTRPDIILSSDSITTQTTTEAGPAKITTPQLVTDLVQANDITASNSITCSGTSITKEIQNIVSSTINLYDDSNWYLNRSCWYLSSFMTAAQYSNWQIDRAELTIKSVKYYVYTSEFAAGNLTDYCPNANSYNGTFAGAHDITTGNLISGIALQRTSANRVYIFLDSVLYPGTYEEHTDWLDTNDNFVYSKAVIVTPATVTTNVVSAQDTTTEKISNISNINGKYVTGEIDTSAANIDLITMKYKATMHEDSELLCYVSWGDLHNLSYGNTISITVNGRYIQGYWYEAGTGTGFSDITTYYDYTNCRYARFSDKEVCIIENNSGYYGYLLCCTSAFMAECTDTDEFYANRAIIDTDQKLGNINIYGNLNIKKLPYYDSYWDEVPSGQLNCEKSIAVNDPNTGNSVQINTDSITIGNTTINEAQLQALLALINT